MSWYHIQNDQIFTSNKIHFNRIECYMLFTIMHNFHHWIWNTRNIYTQNNVNRFKLLKCKKKIDILSAAGRPRLWKQLCCCLKLTDSFIILDMLHYIICSRIRYIYYVHIYYVQYWNISLTRNLSVAQLESASRNCAVVTASSKLYKYSKKIVTWSDGRIPLDKTTLRITWRESGK